METHRRPAAQNYANMRKNGVTINTVPASVRKALKDAATESVNAWKATAGPDAVAIIGQVGKR